MIQTIVDNSLAEAGLASFVADAAGVAPGSIAPGDWTGGEAAERAVARYRERLRSYGRDPNRYRISSDALRRRIQREPVRPIYPLVDAGNALSLATGWPVGCYDLEAIRGDIRLRLGAVGEAVETLAKGLFDVGKLPVLADDCGVFGSPVSDTVRTQIRPDMTEGYYCLYFYSPADSMRLAGQIESVMRGCGLALKSTVLVAK